MVTIIVYLVGAIGYCILGKAETEEYAKSPAETAKRGEDVPLRKMSA
jgi:hypothetical protein